MGNTSSDIVDFNPELMSYTKLPPNYPLGQTYSIFRATLSNFYFAQGATTYNNNILSPNTTYSNIDSVLSGITRETFYTNTYFNPTDKSLLVRNTFKTAFAKEPLKWPASAVGETTITTTQYLLEPETAGVTHINYKKYQLGSCCYCSTTGRTCKNYVSKEYCEKSGTIYGLSGSFSFAACSQRVGFNCNSYGKCCVNGVCLDITEAECNRLNGNFTRNVFCANGTDCP